jgi:predicted GNAT superfamily acetyltransferase
LKIAKITLFFRHFGALGHNRAMSLLRISQVSSIEEMEAVSAFLCKVWAGGPEVVPFDLGIAVLHVGAYCSAAYDGDEMVAASFGFRGVFDGKDILHSHVTGSFQPGAGYELKQHQFNWAKQEGLAGITWSFDPLVRRNCVFNFDKLGATAVEYLPNFYGTMTDEINAGDDSDRLFVYWDLAGAKSAGTISPNAVAVEIPEDIEALRRTNLEEAKLWRSKTRETIEPLMNQGWTIKRMQGRTHLLIEPPK